MVPRGALPPPLPVKLGATRDQGVSAGSSGAVQRGRLSLGTAGRSGQTAASAGGHMNFRGLKYRDIRLADVRGLVVVLAFTAHGDDARRLARMLRLFAAD